MSKLYKLSLLVSLIAVLKLGSLQSTFVNANTVNNSNNNDNDDNVDVLMKDFHSPMLTKEVVNLIKRIKAGGSSSSSGNGSSGNGSSKPGASSSSSSSSSSANLNKQLPLKKRRKKTKSNPADESNTQKTSTGEDAIISTKVTVTIPGYGKAEGRRETGVDIWKGIPYASPPVGSLRFAPPEAATPWAPSKLDASQFGPDCYQLVDPVLNPMADISYMSEDCLYLNVFTPAGHVARSRQGKFLR